MKQKLLVGLAALGLVPAVLAQSTPLYVNPSDLVAYTNAPVIDALAFLNPEGLTFSVADLFETTLYDFTDCQYFTNRGYMFASPGFDFRTKPLEGGEPPRPAAWFVNQGGGSPKAGIIDCTGQSYNYGVGVSGSAHTYITGNGTLLVQATNIIDSGTINMGSSDLISLAGDYVDLTRGSISMTNLYQYYGYNFFSAQVLDGYWGTGLEAPAGMDPAAELHLNWGFLSMGVPLTTPDFYITNRNYLKGYTWLLLESPQVYVGSSAPVNSNMLTEVVFLNNTNPAITPAVFMSMGEIAVQWQWVSTNWPTPTLMTNYVVLTDNFGETTNLQVRQTGTSWVQPTYRPVNYNLYSGLSYTNGLFPQPAIPATNGLALDNLFPTQHLTNDYTAWEADFVPGTGLVTDTPGGDITNLAGRIEISANQYLDLTDTRIASVNYVKLNAPHHFAGASGAQILTPYADLTLASTNGLLTCTNLMAPYVPYPLGKIGCYSARMTNYVTNIIAGATITNTIHVLFVDTRLKTYMTPQVETLNLSATNLVVSDALHVTRNMLLNAQSVTITTNSPDNLTPRGELNLLSPSILWPTATPGLLAFTNQGGFSAANAVFFGGSRSSPAFNPASINIPYNAYVNQGQVSDQGTYVWARYFENSGTIVSGTGLFDLQLGFSVRLHDGAIYNPNSDVSLSASDLVVSNHVIVAGGALTLAVTNYLDDGSYLYNSADSISNKNTWVANHGFSLPLLPPYASLLGTTILSTNLSRQPQMIYWAGEDRGINLCGFYNNAALGRLVLAGQDPDSSFVFVPVCAKNALYVDTLEIVGTLATNKDAANNLLGVVIPANMKIYYGQALLNGSAYSRKLDGKNNGGFVWVTNFNTGFFSSSFINFPSGSHRANTAYVQDYQLRNGGALPPVPVDQVDTAPTNPAPVYPALVLDSGSGSDPAGNGDNNDPAVAGGANRLQLPATATAGAGSPAGKFLTASYSGLFADTNGIAGASSGCFTVRTTAQGHYTGKVMYGGRSYSFSGKLASSSQVASASFSKGALTVSFWLGSADASQLQGRVTGAGWSADLVAFRQATSKSVPAAATMRGTYTLIIPPGTEGPGGFSFGTVTADAAGNVRWAGTLADGSKVTQSSSLSSGGLWGLYASLYGGQGSALGWLQLASGSGTNLSGQCLWVKAAGLGTRYYAQGFTNDVQVIGSAYARPHAGAMLPLYNGAGSLSFSGANLPSAVSKELVLDQHNQVTILDSRAPSLKLNPATGLFSGSVWLSTGKVSFQGAVFQNGHFAAGYFLGTTQSGAVYLSPAP